MSAWHSTVCHAPSLQEQSFATIIIRALSVGSSCWALACVQALAHASAGNMWISGLLCAGHEAHL